MARNERWDDVRLGTLVLGALGILIIGSLWLAAGFFSSPAGHTYSVELDSSGGLQPGDGVRVAGVRVGHVLDVDLDTEQERPVTIEISLRRSIRLHEDAVGTPTSESFFGEFVLDVDPGSDDRPDLEPGGTFYGQAAADFNAMSAQLGDIGERAGELLGKTSELVDQISTRLIPLTDRIERLASDENLDRIGHILADVDATLEKAGPRLDPLIADFHALVKDAQTSVANLPMVVESLDRLLTDLGRVAGPDGERLVAMLERADGTLASADDSLGVIRDNRVEIEMALDDLRETLANLEAFSRLLKERPFSLIRIVPEPERQPGGPVR